MSQQPSKPFSLSTPKPDPKKGKYARKPDPKPVYSGAPRPSAPPVRESITSPFSRDAYPALTDAIMGVVNGQPRQVEEDIQTPERRAETSRAAARAYTGQGRPTTPRQRVALLKRIAKERSSPVVYGTGGKPDTAATARRTLTRQSRAGLLETHTDALGEDIQTPAREREMLGKMKAAEARTKKAGGRFLRASIGGSSQKHMEKTLRNTGKALDTAGRRQDQLYKTQHKEETSRRLYGKGGKTLKRK